MYVACTSLLCMQIVFDPVRPLNLLGGAPSFLPYLAAAFLFRQYLRYKCQVLSSFGNIDEDLFIEGRLLESYRNASSIPAAQDFIEPAPLYVTAVIE